MTTLASSSPPVDEASRPAPSAHAIAHAARSRAGLPRRVRVAGRAARRLDRLARNLAGGGVSGAGAAGTRLGAGDVLAIADLFWISASDRSLHAVCWSGIAISLALIGWDFCPAGARSGSGCLIFHSWWSARSF